MARPTRPDPVLFIVTLLLMSMGVIMVYSASAALALERYQQPYLFLTRQALWTLLSCAVMSITMRIDYRAYRNQRLILTALGVVIILLVGVLFRPPINGTRRWMALAGLEAQPSEFAKLVLVVFSAWKLQRRTFGTGEYRRVILPVALALIIIAGLIVLQPDFGTGLLLCLVIGLMIFASGMRLSSLIGIVLVTTPLAFSLMVGASYRRRRFSAFLNPWTDPLGDGFQIIQSIISFGSGHITGKGLMSGIQKLSYLRDPHTDFIFAVVGEELGLVGTTVVLLSFFLIAWRGLRIALRAADSFGALLAVGLTALVTTQAFANMGTVLGLLPTKGISLPFLSSGGSSVLVSAVAMGIILNVSKSGGATLSSTARPYATDKGREDEGESSPHDPDAIVRNVIKGRSIVLAGAVVLIGLAIETRLVYLQAVMAPDLAARAERQQGRTISVPARRGVIVDRNREVLATAREYSSIYAVPTEIASPEKTARSICGALGDCSNRDVAVLIDRFKETKNFAFVRRVVSPDAARRVAELHLEGVGFLVEQGRFYPRRTTAGHVVGYVGVDNSGLAGIEASANATLEGKAGTRIITTDARRRTVAGQYEQGTKGTSIALTLDVNAQTLTESSLAAVAVRLGARAGAAVVMEPFSGEVLAMASYPPLDPNLYRTASEESRLNRATNYPLRVESLDGIGERLLLHTSSVDVGVPRASSLAPLAPPSERRENGRALEVLAERLGLGASLVDVVRATASDDQSRTLRSPGVSTAQILSLVNGVVNGGAIYEPTLIKGVLEQRQWKLRRASLRGTIPPGLSTDVWDALPKDTVNRGTGQSNTGRMVLVPLAGRAADGSPGVVSGVIAVPGEQQSLSLILWLQNVWEDSQAQSAVRVEASSLVRRLLDYWQSRTPETW